MIFGYSYLVVAIIYSWLLWIHAEGCQNQFPCILNNTNGNITSPGYPVSYPDHVNISWLVIVPHGFTIKLTFESFSLENDDDCDYDHVSLYDGGSTTGSPLIGKYCGKTIPLDQFSTDVKILVVFVSDKSHSGNGFNIHYEALTRVNICSSSHTPSENLNIILSNSTGTLQTILHNKTRTIECTWKIRAPIIHGIRVTLNSLNLLVNSSCSQNSILLYAGYNIQANNLIRKLCGGNFNASNQIVKYNPGRSVIVQLNASLLSSWDEHTFIASYEFVKRDLQKCSLLNTASENTNIKLSTRNRGNFTVDATWANMRCFWKISAPEKQQIKLTFNDFKLLNDCQKAYVEIFDGGTTLKRGRFCGPDKPWVIFSTKGFLWVKLFVFGLSKMLRFTGVYEVITSALNRCSAINSKEVNSNIRLNATSGLIMTANYPSKYPNNFNCTWILTVPKKYRIKLHFKSFQFEGHNCKYDYVEVRDGNSSDSPSKVGKLCGTSSKPSDIYSSSNQMWISFKSDENEQESGFLASYSAILPDPSKCSLVNTNTENNNIQIHRTSGFLTSPNYPQPSPPVECTWYITVPWKYRILVRFYVSLELWCNDVYFAFHDGNCTCSQSLGNFCGTNVPASVVTTGNALTVTFKAINSYFKGFNLSFHVPKTGPDICSITNSNFINNNLYLNETSGQVTSPDYPYPFVPGTECTWYARAPSGYHVFLDIKTMNLPRPCLTTYLDIFDGMTPSNPLAGKLCENSTNRFYSSGQSLVLKFRSSQTTDLRFPGTFTASYRMIKAGKCSKEFDDSWNLNLKIDGLIYGVITSPGYPQNYPGNSRCNWKITVPFPHIIKLTITTLSFGASCQDGMLNVRDGPTWNSPHLAKFCGEAPRTVLISTGKSMFLQFQSGNSSRRGFEAFFAAIDKESEPQPSTFQKVIIIVFIILAAFVLLTFTSMFVYWLLRKRCHPPRRRPSPPEHHDLTNLPSLPPLTLDDIPDCLIAEDRPPSYDDATATEDNGTQQDSPEEQNSQVSLQQQIVEPAESRSQQQEERGLDNPGFQDGSPPSYDSLFDIDEL